MTSVIMVTMQTAHRLMTKVLSVLISISVVKEKTIVNGGIVSLRQNISVDDLWGNKPLLIDTVDHNNEWLKFKANGRDNIANNVWGGSSYYVKEEDIR